eukprot:TRINITY_DN23232_c0_g1_i1.p1 TRINITY_DN23232_c0_g1~~TRINITY_DN23232_c0_g1_i1.p1  ORF type:complete len:494 (+),score=50.84 TRINITY_DN23232_c0_g1_i1:174-1655(+)
MVDPLTGERVLGPDAHCAAPLSTSATPSAALVEPADDHREDAISQQDKPADPQEFVEPSVLPRPLHQHSSEERTQPWVDDADPTVLVATGADDSPPCPDREHHDSDQPFVREPDHGESHPNHPADGSGKAVGADETDVARPPTPPADTVRSNARRPSPPAGPAGMSHSPRRSAAGPVFASFLPDDERGGAPSAGSTFGGDSVGFGLGRPTRTIDSRSVPAVPAQTSDVRPDLGPPAQTIDSFPDLSPASSTPAAPLLPASGFVGRALGPARRLMFDVDLDSSFDPGFGSRSDANDRYGPRFPLAAHRQRPTRPTEAADDVLPRAAAVDRRGRAPAAAAVSSSVHGVVDLTSDDDRPALSAARQLAPRAAPNPETGNVLKRPAQGVTVPRPASKPMDLVTGQGLSSKRLKLALAHTGTAGDTGRSSPDAGTQASPQASIGKCPVCRDVPVEPSSARCGHVCCQACWQRCLETKLECPVCRVRTRLGQLTKLFLS